jgi:hypothetical protein
MPKKTSVAAYAKVKKDLRYREANSIVMASLMARRKAIEQEEAKLQEQHSKLTRHLRLFQLEAENAELRKRLGVDELEGTNQS